jgi:hypothetical protein
MTGPRNRFCSDRCEHPAPDHLLFAPEGASQRGWPCYISVVVGPIPPAAGSLCAKRRDLLLRSAALILIGSLSACAPSDPSPGRAGLRMDGSVISVLVPDCAANFPVSVEVTPVVRSTSTATVWSASGFTGSVSAQGLRLGPGEWSTVEGDYSGLTEFEVDVFFSRGYVATAMARPGTIGDLENLPSGVFVVDGARMTAEDFFATANSQRPCTLRTPRT